MGETTEHRSDIQAAYSAGMLMAETLTRALNSTVQPIIEAAVAEAYLKGSKTDDVMTPYLQGMWHKVGKRPLSTFDQPKPETKEKIV